jgi:hypothetical protein
MNYLLLFIGEWQPRYPGHPSPVMKEPGIQQLQMKGKKTCDESYAVMKRLAQYFFMAWEEQNHLGCPPGYSITF